MRQLQPFLLHKLLCARHIRALGSEVTSKCHKLIPALGLDGHQAREHLLPFTCRGENQQLRSSATGLRRVRGGHAQPEIYGRSLTVLYYLTINFAHDAKSVWVPHHPENQRSNSGTRAPGWQPMAYQKYFFLEERSGCFSKNVKTKRFQILKNQFISSLYLGGIRRKLCSSCHFTNPQIQKDIRWS